LTFSNQGNPYQEIDRILEETVVPFFPEEEKNSTTPTTLSNTTRIESQTGTENQRRQGLTPNWHLPQAETVNKDSLKQDERLFVRLCEEGRLYEELMGRMEMRTAAPGGAAAESR